MVCWLCPSLSFPPASKVVVIVVCLFVFSRDSVVKCTCDAVLGRGERSYNPVYFQSGSGSVHFHIDNDVDRGGGTLGNAIFSFSVGMDSFLTF